METTKTEMLMDDIRTRIANRVLGPGDRMPSIRRFATATGSSPSTVAEAYDRLVAEGLIRSRRGSGFFVANTKLPPIKVAELGPRRPRDIDPFWVSRQTLGGTEGMLKPGSGFMPSGWMPLDGVRKGLRGLARGGGDVLTDYGAAHGAPALRKYLLRRMANEGMSIGPNQVMLTPSATQALDLVCRLFLRPGDTVLIDDPCYYNFQALFQAHRATVHSVPYTRDGPDLAAFEAALKDLKPRLYVANSAIHNPTGATMTPRTVHRLLALSVEHDLTVVEDDVWADLEPEPSARMAVLDGLERVIRIGSFTKTISASARCGYIAARADWIEALVDMQLATNLGGPSPISTELIASVVTSASYPRYLSELHERLSKARKVVAEKLEAFGIEPWIMPRGGFLLWCRFPDGIDTGKVAQRCIEDGVVMAPGNVFSPAQVAGAFMRFNVTQTNDQRVYRTLEKSLKSVGQEMKAGG